MSDFEGRRLADIPNTETRVAEFDLRVRRGSDDEVRLTLLEAMGDTFPPLRHRAALAASERDDESLDELLRVLALGESEEAVELADAMGLDPRLVPAPQSEVRQAACLGLRGSHTEETRQTLLEAADDDAADVRYQALVSLHDLGVADEAIAELIDRRLQDEDPEVVVVAAQIATQRGWTDRAQAISERWQELEGSDKLQLALSLAELIGEHDVKLPGDQTSQLIDELIEALEDEETIAGATQGLVQLGADRAIEPLKNVLGRWFAHPILKVEVAAALHVLGDADGTVYLEKMLHGSRRDARGYTLRLIGRLRISAYFDEVAQVAQSDDYHADTAVLALADYGGEEGRAVLEDVAKDHPDEEIRELAASELERSDELGSLG